MNAIAFNIATRLGTDLSSRSTAARLRDELLNFVNEKHEPALLDFAGVRTISNSFADELFAVVVEKYGRDGFRSRFSLRNLDDCVRYTILESIAERLRLTGTVQLSGG